MENLSNLDLSIGQAARLLGLTIEELRLLIKKENITGCYKDERNWDRFSPEAVRYLQTLLQQEIEVPQTSVNPAPDWAIFGVLMAATYALLSALLEGGFTFVSTQNVKAGYFLLVIYFVLAVSMAGWVWKNWPNQPKIPKKNDESSGDTIH